MVRAIALVGALGVAQESAPPAVAPTHAIRIPLLDSLSPTAETDGAPEPLVQEVALAALARASTSDTAAGRAKRSAFLLPFRVARDDHGPLPFELLDESGRALELGFGHQKPKAQLIAGEQSIDCLREPAFKGLERRRFETVEEPSGRGVWIDRDGSFELEFERFDAPARLWLVGAIVGGFQPGLSPRVTLLEGSVELGAKDCANRRELDRPFELPRALGPQKLVLRVDYPSGEAAPPRLALARLRLVEEPARDRLLLTVTGSDWKGWKLRYLALAPPAVDAIATPSTIERGAARTTRIAAALAGEAALVVDPPQRLQVSIDGGEPSRLPDAPVAELPIRFATSGEHELVVTSAQPLAGTLWLVQPESLRHAKLALGRGPLPRAALDAASRVVAPVQRERDARPALLLAPGEAVELPLPEGKGLGRDRLELALAADSLAEERIAPARLRASLSLVTAGGDVVELAARDVAMRAAWDEVGLELPDPGEGAGARLRIEASGPEGMAIASRTMRLLVGEPTLRRVVPGAAPRNVVVYLIDTLRADHCSAYGYARKTTPALESLAQDGLLFERAWAQAPWTRPATATIFTGLLYPYHGAGKTTELAAGVETFAERMRAAGRTTAAFVANPHVYAGALQFEQGFGTFVTEETPESQFRSDRIHADVAPWLERHEDEPFFLYVHTVDPHAAYDPPAATRGAFQDPAYAGPITPPRTHTEILRERLPLPPADHGHVVDLYDEEILFNDRQLGALVDVLKRLGAYDETTIVVLSDHGEEFEEHGRIGHAGALWEELLRVPLVIKPPRSRGLAPARIAAPARQMDVLPTALALVDAPAGAPLQGVDLRPWILERDHEPLWVLAHEQPDLRCLIQDGMKLIQDGERSLLFDLTSDPAEKFDLATRRADLAAAMARRIDALMQQFDSAGFVRHESGHAAELDAAERAALRKLGYAGD
jgi:arylsulfatase